MSAVDSKPRKLRLRYPAVCSVCGIDLPRGTAAYWDSLTKKACCLGCTGETLVVPEPETFAGGSALAKAASLEERAVRHARARWGNEAAAVAEQVVQRDPAVLAWEKGGEGESWLASYIRHELGPLLSLHDRLIPGTRAANIDHLFIVPSGVWIVDAKTYKGTVEKREYGPIWRRENELYVGRRNRSKLADGLTVQITAVKAALRLDERVTGVPVFPALCFVDTDWPWLLSPFDVHGVNVVNPRDLRDYLRKRGSLSQDVMERVHFALSKALPPARR